ncbi:MAG TPA: hypothetical protein VNX01_12305 [Bacteroidia bacterium]|jgi:hypothetical protein|nr:hypothetical protein [Bacteroidia bacterium]
MKKSKLIILLLLTTLLSGCCVWRSGFFIVNKTNNKIIITYSITSNTEGQLALGDEIGFYKLDSTDDIAGGDGVIGESFKNDYTKKVTNGVTEFETIINPNTAMSGGIILPGFTHAPNDKMRHQMFNNIINMRIIRMDTKDTLNLKPSSLSDFTTRVGRHHTGLIFD